MFTCCPQCQTCFRVTAAQLKVAQGKVRCGKCHGVFNAKNALYERDPSQTDQDKPRSQTIPPLATKPEPVAQSIQSASSDKTTKVERNDHQHISLNDADASSDSIDAIFDALDEQLTSGVFNDIRDIKPAPQPAVDVDIDSYFHKQITELSQTSNTSKAVKKTDSTNTKNENITATTPENFSHDTQQDDRKRADSKSDRSAPASTVPTSKKEDDNFLASLRKKTAAESQQLELNISHSPVTRAASLQSKTAPEQLKQVIDRIIQSKAPSSTVPFSVLPEESDIAFDTAPEDEFVTADAFTIYTDEDDVTNTDLSALNGFTPEPDIDDKPVQDSDSASLDDDPEDMFDDAEDLFEFHSSTELPENFNDAEAELELDINNEFELMPVNEDFSNRTQSSENKFSFEPIAIDHVDKPDFSSQAENAASESASYNDSHYDAYADIEDDNNFTDLEEIIATPVANSEDEWDKVLAKSSQVEHIVPHRLRDSVDTLAESETSITKQLFMAVATLICVALLAFQVLIFKSTELVQRWPSLRDSMVSLCDTLPCRFTGKRDLKKVTMLSRDIRVHPQNKAALLITAAMTNQASFAQPYPDILLRFTDLTGEVIAQRRFNPQEYLGKIYRPFILMPANTPVHLTFAVLDPGSEAINFEFDFL